MNSKTALIDFETRSACSLRNCGSWRYSLDPTSEVLCLGFRLPYWDAGQVSLWHPAFPHLDIPESDNWPQLVELLEWIQEGKLVEAHNASFERAIWKNILSQRYGWPAIQISQWRCSAAKSAAHALPRSLEDACLALRLAITKDAVGHKLMMKLSKPRKPRKAEREAGITRLLWWETPALFEQLWAYCRQDILAEEALSLSLPNLSGPETALYILDQTINERGFQLDADAVTTALRLIEAETKILNRELGALTGGIVKKATQRARMVEWLATEGLDIPNTQKETIDEALQSDRITPVARRGLELLRALGRSSTAKYQAMANHMAPDGRIRGGLLYHGASTGRWSGSGVQPHNFTKGSVKDQNELWEVLKTRDREFITSQYTGVMEALSNGLRGAIVAAPGKQLYVADYAGIEARVVQWIANDQEALDFFRTGGDTYKDIAASIYDVPVAKVTKDQRFVGKFAILGLGYGMGWAKFQATCEGFGVSITDKFAQRVVEVYREKFWRLVEHWGDQERAAIRATRGLTSPCGYTVWYKEDKFLYCQLPSGRNLAYPFPEIRPRMTPWGAEKEALTFMGINSYTRKWERQGTYGGSIVENIVQAIARDLMANAMQRCELAGYPVVLTVHDEIISEVPLLAGSVQEFEGLLTEVPEWAEGCPVAAEGWVGTRYRK